MMLPLLHTWNLNLGYAKRLAAVRGGLPALGDCAVFVMAAHENMHLGQVSAWRRVQGMGRV
jgi:hypothetical protein